MTLEVVKQKSRGFICVNAHPEGCRLNIERQIDVVAAGAAAGERGRFRCAQNL